MTSGKTTVLSTIFNISQHKSTLKLNRVSDCGGKEPPRFHSTPKACLRGVSCTSDEIIKYIPVSKFVNKPAKNGKGSKYIIYCIDGEKNNFVKGMVEHKVMAK